MSRAGQSAGRRNSVHPYSLPASSGLFGRVSGKPQGSEREMVVQGHRLPLLRAIAPPPFTGRLTRRRSLGRATRRNPQADQRAGTARVHRPDPRRIGQWQGAGRGQVDARAGPDGPFVPVDCTTLTGTLFESQLFGHVHSAIPGARQTSTLGFFRRRRRHAVPRRNRRAGTARAGEAAALHPGAGRRSAGADGARAHRRA